MAMPTFSKKFATCTQQQDRVAHSADSIPTLCIVWDPSRDGIRRWGEAEIPLLQPYGPHLAGIL
jgi:hypothetical protein